MWRETCFLHQWIQTKIFSLCLKNFPCVITKFPVFSLSGKSKNQIPCAVATLQFENMKHKILLVSPRIFLQCSVTGAFKFKGSTLVFFRDRLSASDMLQVRKVIEHVYEKVMGQGSDSGSQTAGGPGTSTTSQEKSETEKDEDLASIAEEKVELLCNEQVRFNILFDIQKAGVLGKECNPDLLNFSLHHNLFPHLPFQTLNPNMDLRTVKHFIWKQGGDLTLHYRPINNK